MGLQETSVKDLRLGAPGSAAGGAATPEAVASAGPGVVFPEGGG